MVCVKGLVEEWFMYMLKAYEDSIFPSVQTSLWPDLILQKKSCYEE